MRRLFVLLLFGASVAAGCASEKPQAPASAPAALSTPAAAAAPPAAAAREPASLTEIFPPGAAREAVLNNCGSCHNVACAAMQGRPPERWDALRAAHKERVSNVDLDMVFGYLKEHFDEGKALPRVPAKFLEGGCTPF